MAAVIDGSAVDEDQVLVDAAAPHAETGGAFTGRLHARHHLDDADDVVLAHERGHFLDQGGIDTFQTHLGELDLLPLGPREDGGGLQLAPVDLQVEIQLRRLGGVHGHFRRLIAEIGAVDGVLSSWNVKRVESDAVRGDTRLLVFQIDDSLGERLAALCVAHVSGKDYRTGLRTGEDGSHKESHRRHGASERDHCWLSDLAADWPAR